MASVTSANVVFRRVEEIMRKSYFLELILNFSETIGVDPGSDKGLAEFSHLIISDQNIKNNQALLIV